MSVFRKQNVSNQKDSIAHDDHRNTKENSIKSMVPELIAINNLGSGKKRMKHLPMALPCPSPAVVSKEMGASRCGILLIL